MSRKYAAVPHFYFEKKLIIIAKIVNLNTNVMVTVRTKVEFNEALKQKPSVIHVEGELAETIRKRTKIKKIGKGAGLALLIGGVVLLPFTGGASVASIGAGAMALTVGTVSVSVAELAILVGGVIAVLGVLKGAKVKFNSDGSVEIEPKYKD